MVNMKFYNQCDAFEYKLCLLKRKNMLPDRIKKIQFILSHEGKKKNKKNIEQNESNEVLMFCEV